MEQDHLPCSCDQEVFERVWRRVMPEDRPDCPFTLGEDAAAPPAVQPPAAALPAVVHTAPAGEQAYWPVDRVPNPSPAPFSAALREHFMEEQRGAAAYQTAAAETADPCLHELFLELAGEEDSHAWLLRSVLEQL